MATHDPSLIDSLLAARQWARGKVEPYLTWLPGDSEELAVDVIAVLVIVSAVIGIWKKAAEICRVVMWLPRYVWRRLSGADPPKSEAERVADETAQRIETLLEDSLRARFESQTQDAELGGQDVPEDAVERAVAASQEILSSNDPDKAEAQEALRNRDPVAAEAALERAFNREADAATRIDDEARQLKTKAARTAREKAALAATRSVAEALLWYGKAAEFDPDDFWTQIEICRLHQANGNLAAAADAARSAHSAAEGDRDHSVASDAIGDVLVAQGDLGKALESYQTSMVIRKRLAQADASNAGLQRDLSVSHERIGDVLEESGRISRAIEAYEASLVLTQRLADRWPDHPQFRSDLAITKRRLNELRAKRG